MIQILHDNQKILSSDLDFEIAINAYVNAASA